MRLLGIIGAGGFGREVMPLARQMIEAQGLGSSGQEPHELAFVVEDSYPIPQPRVNGHRVISLSEFLSAPAERREYSIAIRNSAARERIASSIPWESARPLSIVSTSHVRLDDSFVGEGAILCAFSQITSNSRVGRFFNGNYYSYVAHDCIIGDYVTFAPGVKCNGHVVVESHAYIGAGAVIKDATDKPIVIGRGAVVGMGAVVTRSVPAGATVVGNPARLLARPATDA